MSTPDDGPREDPAQDDSGLPLDEDAAWRSIVEHYGERAVLEPPTREALRPSAGRPSTEPPGPPATPPLESLRPAERRRPRGQEPPAEEPADHDHFVPPDPPPLPKPTPARRLAWTGLFLPPVVMLLAVVFAWTFAMWFSLALVAAFVGGFVFLVVTMPNGDGDDWDDGAVL